MKKLHFPFCLFSLLMLVSSCRNVVSPDDVVYITGGDAVSTMFDAIVTDCSVEPLTSDLPLDASTMIVRGNTILMSNSDRSKLQFLQDNRLVSELSAKGRGPGEYSMINSYTYCPESSVVFLSSVSKQDVLCYDAATMRYIGCIPSDCFVSELCMLDDSTLLAVRYLDDEGNCLAAVDIHTGESEKLCDLSQSESSMYFYPQSASQYEIAYSVNNFISKICYIGNDDACHEFQKFCFTDGMPEDMFNQGNGEEFTDESLSYISYSFSEHYYGGIFMPLITDDGYTFWYANHNSPSQDSWDCLYRKSGDRIIQAKNIIIPGIKNYIEPDGLTDDGRYFTVFAGTSDMLEDPEVNPSDLARQILDAVDAQNDCNPVVLYYRIK